MSDEPRSLDRLQRWMQSVISFPFGVKAGVDSDEARQEIDVASDQVESVILPSVRRTSLQRLEVYGNAYYARLLECLRDVFPTLLAAVGEEAFDELTFGYLQACPPRSYTLDRLGDRFADFLEESRPDRDCRERPPWRSGTPQRAFPTESHLPELEPDWPDFLIELARLDWTIGEVFDGPGIEQQPTLTAEQLLAISPERWAEARLVPAPCLRVLSFRFPINDYFTAVRAGTEPEIPDPADSYLALTRREWIVRRLELSAWQYALLEAIVSGQSVGDAIEQAAEMYAGDEAGDDPSGLDQFADQLRQKFSQWSAAQLFLAVELSPD